MRTKPFALHAMRCKLRVVFGFQRIVAAVNCQNFQFPVIPRKRCHATVKLNRCSDFDEPVSPLNEIDNRPPISPFLLTGKFLRPAAAFFSEGCPHLIPYGADQRIVMRATEWQPIMNGVRREKKHPRPGSWSIIRKKSGATARPAEWSRIPDTGTVDLHAHSLQIRA